MRHRNRFWTASQKDIVESRKKLKLIKTCVRVQIFIIFEYDEREKNAACVIANSADSIGEAASQFPRVYRALLQQRLVPHNLENF